MFTSSQNLEKLLHQLVNIPHLFLSLKFYFFMFRRTTNECKSLINETEYGYYCWLPLLFSNFLRNMNSCVWEKNQSFEMIIVGMILWWTFGELQTSLDIDPLLSFVIIFLIGFDKSVYVYFVIFQEEFKHSRLFVKHSLFFISSSNCWRNCFRKTF